eukprot:5976347-Pyramimonas_sp.AAC.1
MQALPDPCNVGPPRSHVPLIPSPSQLRDRQVLAQHGGPVLPQRVVGPDVSVCLPELRQQTHVAEALRAWMGSTPRQCHLDLSQPPLHVHICHLELLPQMVHQLHGAKTCDGIGRRRQRGPAAPGQGRPGA